MKKIYIEGGGNSKEGRIRCREGFRKLFESCGFKGRMPSTAAYGSRNETYDRFKSAIAGSSKADYIALLVDSEDPVKDSHKVWEHLKWRDNWERPQGTDDNQALLMTTCMETWIVADHNALGKHFGQHLQQSALPHLDNLESRPRGDVQQKLMQATRDCHSPYTKGPKSFVVLGKLAPDVIAQYLPSFQRMRKILETKL